MSNGAPLLMRSSTVERSNETRRGEERGRRGEHGGRRRGEGEERELERRRGARREQAMVEMDSKKESRGGVKGTEVFHPRVSSHSLERTMEHGVSSFIHNMDPAVAVSRLFVRKYAANSLLPVSVNSSAQIACRKSRTLQDSTEAGSEAQNILGICTTRMNMECWNEDDGSAYLY
eukprot:760523-Hanusia_phi.AAC.4